MKCGDCEKEIPAKRLAAVPNAQYCVTCQSKRDVFMRPPDLALVEFAEGEDVTRVVENGWGEVSHTRRPRTLNTQRVTAIYHLQT